MKKILLLVFIAFLVGCKPHEHTPLVRKAYDDQYHWNVASCGHDVKLNQAQGSYTFNKLTDGTVYKLRFLSYIKNGKLTALSTPWPDNKASNGDSIHIIHASIA